jgi:glucuronate isomerase
MRNPLYHWTHLELKRAFGVDELLSPKTAREIFDICTEKLRTPEYSARGLMKMFNVETVCTTDDPVDSLEYHLALKKEGFEVKVLPAWRPDKAMAVENPAEYRAYVEKLSNVSGITISKFSDLIEALRKRHDFFASIGCKLSDHGIEEFYAEPYTQTEIESIFNKVYGGTELSKGEMLKFKSAMLYEGAIMDWEKDGRNSFTMDNSKQQHRLFKTLGPDTGFDSIGDFTVAKNMSRFLVVWMWTTNGQNDYLQPQSKRQRSCGHNDRKLSDGSVPVKSNRPHWFLDQKNGMEAQMNSLSNLGLLTVLWECSRLAHFLHIPVTNIPPILCNYRQRC